MTTDLIPRFGGGLPELRTGRGRLAREIDRAVEREVGLGRVQAARVAARARVARRALAEAAMLSKDEEGWISLAPLGEDRYKTIVDAFTMFARWEITS